jgi:hypothetical protein
MQVVAGANKLWVLDKFVIESEGGICLSWLQTVRTCDKLRVYQKVLDNSVSDDSVSALLGQKWVAQKIAIQNRRDHSVSS